MSQHRAASIIAGGAGSIIGLLVGARFHDHAAARSLLVICGLDDLPSVWVRDPQNATEVLEAAVELSNRCGGFGILSTVGADGVSARLMQPLPLVLEEARDDPGKGTSGAKQPPSIPRSGLFARTKDVIIFDGNDDEALTSAAVFEGLQLDLVGITFHTSKNSRKFKELTRNSSCAISYVSPKDLTCVTFRGRATRLPPPKEAILRQEWPLLPPLAYEYGSEKATAEHFSAWRLDPSSIEVVAPLAGLKTPRSRVSWQAPTLSRSATTGAWQVSAPGSNEEEAAAVGRKSK